MSRSIEARLGRLEQREQAENALIVIKVPAGPDGDCRQEDVDLELARHCQERGKEPGPGDLVVVIKTFCHRTTSEECAQR